MRLHPLIHSTAWAVLGLTLSASAGAQSDAWSDVTSEELTALLSGKKISADHVRGGTVRLDLRANGTLYGNHSAGGSDSGKWRVEGSKLCMEWRRWDYQGCGLVQKSGDRFRHLYPDQSPHLTFGAS